MATVCASVSALNALTTRFAVGSRQQIKIERIPNGGGVAQDLLVGFSDVDLCTRRTVEEQAVRSAMIQSRKNGIDLYSGSTSGFKP